MGWVELKVQMEIWRRHEEGDMHGETYAYQGWSPVPSHLLIYLEVRNNSFGCVMINTFGFGNTTSKPNDQSLRTASKIAELIPFSEMITDISGNPGDVVGTKTRP